jgi:NADH:ubiquinone oxidoreductase subunit 3 (subunit A)
MTNMPTLLAPPLAFLMYLGLVGVLFGLGRLLADRRPSTRRASIIYSSGEAPARTRAAPGYQPFFGVALFFAILHLGILIASTGALGVVGLAYIGGLLLVLLVVLLG